MAIFNQPETHTATSIGEIQYEFRDGDGTPTEMTGRAHASVLNESGQHHWGVNVGNLEQHLTTEEKQQLLTMFVRLRELAATELL